MGPPADDEHDSDSDHGSDADEDGWEWVNTPTDETRLERSSEVDSTDDDREWRFAVDEVGPDADDDGDREEHHRPPPIEPESIALEHAIFVLLGVALAVFVLLTAL